MVGHLTLGDLVDGGREVAVRFFKREHKIDIGPVGEHLLQCAQFIEVALLQLAKLALVCGWVEGGGSVAVGGFVWSRSSSAVSASTAARGRAPATRRPGLCFRHVGCGLCVRAAGGLWVERGVRV